MNSYISNRLSIYRNSVLIGGLLFILSLAAPLSAQTAGSLDPTFNNTGIVRTAFGNNDSEPYGLAVQPDGKIVVSGTVFSPLGSFAVVRYNPNGSLDTLFGTGGKVVTPVGMNAYSCAVALQPDGKIVIAGTTENATADFAVVRYNSNGSLDTTFGSGGIVVTAVGNNNDIVASVALQADGKIVVGGSTLGSDLDYAIVRYNPNGSLDNSFDGDGKVVKSVTSEDHAGSLAFQSNGKILITGTSKFGARYNFVTMRFNTDGSLDTTLVPNGIVISQVGDNMEARDIVVQPDDKFLVVGGVVINGSADFGLIRYDALGLFDNSFGNAGKVFTPIYDAFDTATSVVLQTNGKIVVGGTGCIVDTCDFAITRYNPNGSPDTTFDADGKVTTPVGAFYPANVLVAVQPDGNIIAAGIDADGNSNGSRIDFTVARYLASNRSTKFDFDGDGKADVSVFRPENGAWYLNQSASGFAAVQFGAGTDKLVPADYDGDGKTDVAVYRNGVWYLNRSQLGFVGATFGEATDVPQPADFDGDGRAELAVFRPSNGFWYVYNLATNQSVAFQFGASEDKPVAADYDADGKADYAVFRPSTGTWYLQRSTLGFTGVQFGESADQPVPADYDGDGKTDVAVFRPSTGTWYLQRSASGFTGIAFGAGTDAPTPADYDGDGRADVAVFRNGTWYLNRSTQGFTGLAFGAATDKPVPNAFIP